MHESSGVRRWKKHSLTGSQSLSVVVYDANKEISKSHVMLGFINSANDINMILKTMGRE